MFSTIPIKEIEWGTREREDYGDINELANSMEEIGLINPITIEKPNLLRAGGRRLTAAIQLGWNTIPIRYFEDLTEIERIFIELEENVNRKDLDWAESVRLKAKLNTLMKAKALSEGKKWSTEDTAKVLKVSSRHVQKELVLAKAIKENPSLAKEESKSHAYTKVRRMEDGAKRALSVMGKDLADDIRLGDAVEEMSSIPENSIDLILFDPPFAERFNEKASKVGAYHEVYGEMDDTEDEVFPMVAQVLVEAKRILKEGSHMYMFFSLRPKKFHELSIFIREAGLNYQEQPGFWIKPSNHNFQPYHRMTVNYEPFFFIWKGGKPRDFSKQTNATFPHPVGSNKDHPASKPISLYLDLVSLSTSEGETVLDPTVGSGMSLVAAKSLKRKIIGIEKLEEWYNLVLTNINKIGDK